MDAHEIIAQLKADPALLAQVRAVVLSEDLLGVPERLHRLESALEALVRAVDQLRVAVEEHSRQIAALTARTDQLGAEMAELRSMFGRFMVATGEALGRIEAKLDEQGRTLDEQGRVLDQQGRVLDQHGRKLDENGMGLARLEEHLD